MQQVRTVLLGLRQLPLLTPECYREAGGLRGVETLVISRAVRRAGDAVGGEAGVRAARALLGALIQPGGPNRPPKAQRVSPSVLCDIAGGQFPTETILCTLQGDEVVRDITRKPTRLNWTRRGRWATALSARVRAR